MFKSRWTIRGLVRGLSAAFVVLCIITLCLIADPPRSFSERAESGRTVDIQKNDPVLRQAMDKGRSSLEQFLAKARNPAADTDGYAVKVGIPAGRNTEYFWVNDFTAAGDTFTGKINNEPRYTSLV